MYTLLNDCNNADNSEYGDDRKSWLLSLVYHVPLGSALATALGPALATALAAAFGAGGGAALGPGNGPPLAIAFLKY